MKTITLACKKRYAVIFQAMLPILVFSVFVSNACQAQRWIEMADTATNFFTVRDSFYAEWEGKPYERGKGYKQFKRWEWFMEQRVGPDGKFDPTLAWRETEKFKSANSTQFKSLQPSVTWTPLGPTNWTTGAGWNAGNGRINVIVQDPVDANTIYVGAASGGLWKSIDGGMTWVPLSDNQAVLGVSGIAIDPNNTNTIYIGTGDGDGFNTYGVGVLKSTDGGATWSTTGPFTSPGFSYPNAVMKRLLMHPSDPTILFAATNSGLFKTTNAGGTWSQVLIGANSGGNSAAFGVQDVKFHPTDANIVYACSDEFYRSTDGGNSFVKITSGLPVASSINRLKIAVSIDEPDWVYVVGGKQSDHTFQGIYRSTDSGLNFVTGTNTPNMFGYATNGNDNLGQSFYDMAITVNPADANEVYIGGINIWKSTDGGSTFTIKTQWENPNPIGYVHADIHDLAFHGTRLYVGSDGGIYKSEDYGDTWTNLTAGLGITQFYDIGGSPQNASLMIGGSQDNGTNIFSGSPTWTHVIGADGMTCLVNPANQSTLYGSMQEGVIQKSTNGGVSFSTIIEPADFFGEDAYWVAPFALDPADTNKIFVGYEQMYRSTDGGATWNVNTVGNLADTRVIKIAPSNSNYIYISKGSWLYKSTDGGATWADISWNLPMPSYFRSITDIAIHPLDSNKVWVTNSAGSFPLRYQVLESTDGGNTWKNISENLPNLPANCVAVQPNSNDRLYVGLDVGIYTKDASEVNWTALGTGFPNVIVQDIEVNTGAGKIQVGTYGRGAWQADIPWSEYCLPAFNHACSDGFFIDGVVFDSIQNIGTGCAWPGTPNFSDYTHLKANLAAGASYPITLTAGAANGLYFAAMIDFNADGDFADAGEFFDIGYANAGASVAGSIAVPATVATGTTTLRILGRSGTTPLTQAMICATFDDGEVEDYAIVFVVPNCTKLSSPLHGATNAPLTAALSWEPALGIPAVTGYRIDLGTTTGGTQLLNNFDVGNVTTFDPPGNFLAGSQVFVTVRPYNGVAAATCTEENFRTAYAQSPITCLPTFYFPCNGPFSSFIDDVSFHTLNNLNTACASPGTNNYSDYTNLSTNLERGETYEITLGGNGIWPTGQSFAVLIDFNQDLFFSENEFFQIGWAPLNGAVSGSITVPGDAAIGTSRMRVFALSDNVAIQFNGVCATWTNGEVEEYSVNILLPACTALASPANGAMAVPATADLSWAAASADPAVQGYRLDVGTSPGGTDVLDNFDVGNATTFDPPGNLPSSSTIYVTIRPYNANGFATGCLSESFTTAACTPNLTFSNLAIPSGTYWSEGDLTAILSTVTTGSSVVFKSDTGVLLEQDFTVLLGGALEVVIEGCPASLSPGVLEGTGK